MPNCPHCGKTIPDDRSRTGTTVLSAFLESIGGAEALGRRIAADYDESEAHTRMMYAGKALGLIEAEDKAKSRQQEIEHLEQAQEQAILMEHVIWLIQNDETFLPRALKIVEKRQRLTLVASEAE